MPRNFIDYPIDAPYLLPPDLDDWLPEDHLARVIKELVSTLDLEAFYQVYDERHGRGRPPYHPAMMLSLLLYGYCTGVFSSRKIERSTYESVAFRFLAANQHPDHDTIAAFRRRHIDQIKDVFVQVVLICREIGMVKLGHVAIDGTKIKANASRRKTLERKQLEKAIKKQRRVVDDLLKRAEQADQDETPDDHRVNKELARAKTRLQKLEEAQAWVADVLHLRDEAEKERNEVKEEREQQTQQAREKAQLQRQAAGRELRRIRLVKGLSQRQLGQVIGLSRQSLSHWENGTRRPSSEELIDLEKALGVTLLPFPSMPARSSVGDFPSPSEAIIRYNLTDPESGLMKPRRWETSFQGYNPQAAVDEEHQIIVATGISNSSNDAKNLIPMVKEIRNNLKELPQTLTADTGYCSVKNFSDPSIKGIQVLIPPEKRTREFRHSHPVIAEMRAKVIEHKEAYNARSQVVEPPFGRIKENLGFRRFSLRGLKNTLAEWTLVATAHNVLKYALYRTK